MELSDVTNCSTKAVLTVVCVIAILCVQITSNLIHVCIWSKWLNRVRNCTKNLAKWPSRSYYILFKLNFTISLTIPYVILIHLSFHIQVVIRPMMYIALTYDHRLIDGREAVTFLRTIKAAVEDPRAMLLDL